MLKSLLSGFLYSGLFLLLGLCGSLVYMTWMPNPKSKEITGEGSDGLEALEQQLKTHVKRLAANSAGRNFIVSDTLTPARRYIEEQFVNAGLPVENQSYEIYGDLYANIIVNFPATGDSKKVLIVGAHYDSVENSPGANDNASGVAALIEIGKYLSHQPLKHNVRLIAFVNEEPPFFQTEEMGSLVYARSLSRDGEDVIGMIALETIGCYIDKPGSQKYPKLFNLLYPDTGNFISFIGNLTSRSLLTRSISLFREHSPVPSEGIAAPAFIPGVSWSDHWSFWVTGHTAIMITDTAPYRYDHYHQQSDTPDKLNYEQYSKVVHGLFYVVQGLANEGD